MFSLPHWLGFVRHYYNDGTRRGNVTDGRTRMAGTAIRGEPDPPEGGGLPDARLAERGGRRRAGSLATARPLRDERRREPRRMADDGRRAGVPGHAALAQVAARAAPGRALARSYREPRRCDRPRARSATGRLGRSGAACPTPNAGSRRAARVRAARHVRRALRGDRSDRGAISNRSKAA